MVNPPAMEGKRMKDNAQMEMGPTKDGEDEKGSSTMRTAETLLRILPMALCVVALVIMLKDSQTNEFGSLSYSDIGAFRYLVHASGICAGYSLLSAVVAAVPKRSTISRLRAWTFFVLDQLLTYIILAAGAISTEVVYLAYKGGRRNYMEPNLRIIWWFLPEGHRIHCNHIHCYTLLCRAYTHLRLQAFQ
ncbi:CASP-like protein 2A1 [Abeliophyllum distichum]|uniref:CASP-like protein n=1 Tax=Abeliophyllum distichum TaxID=126358 RepID=A0ABD1QLX1_9LAMI